MPFFKYISSFKSKLVQCTLSLLNLVMNKQKPLIIILGPTGAGKTKLSIELAQKYNGEIISADSMQVYKGLDIVTNKATMEERKQIPHHLIDLINPSEVFTVVDFRNRALKIIKELEAKDKVPIVVGGTNYYIESLLWNILVENEDSDGTLYKPGAGIDVDPDVLTPELHKQLQKIDPETAKRLHPNNRRKIVRALEIAKNMGVLQSELVKRQQSEAGGSTSGGPLRFKNAIIFWVQCEQKVLDERLDKRVDIMIERGLINELLNFHKAYNRERFRTEDYPDYSKGIFQSIGFKEFHNYMMLSGSRQLTKFGRSCLEKGLYAMKLATRRYARTQRKWVIYRFLGRTDREAPPVYSLDTTDPSLWKEKVYEPAINVVDSFLAGTEPTVKPIARRDVTCNPSSLDETLICETCDRVFVGKYQYNLHLESNSHKKVLSGKRKRSENESEDKENGGDKVQNGEPETKRQMVNGQNKGIKKENGECEIVSGQCNEKEKESEHGMTCETLNGQHNGIEKENGSGITCITVNGQHNGTEKEDEEHGTKRKMINGLNNGIEKENDIQSEIKNEIGNEKLNKVKIGLQNEIENAILNNAVNETHNEPKRLKQES